MWTICLNGEPYATADSQAEGLDFAARYNLYAYGTVEVLLLDYEDVDED
jgi:hypothetical protein